MARRSFYTAVLLNLSAKSCGPPCIRISNIRTSNANCWCRTHKTGLNAQGEQNYISTVCCVQWLPSIGAEFHAQVSRVRIRGQVTKYLNFIVLLPRLSMEIRSHITIIYLPTTTRQEVSSWNRIVRVKWIECSQTVTALLLYLVSTHFAAYRPLSVLAHTAILDILRAYNSLRSESFRCCTKNLQHPQQ